MKRKHPYNGTKVSELIKQLEYFQDKLGDIPVTIIAPNGDRFAVDRAWGPSERPEEPHSAVIYIDVY